MKSDQKLKVGLVFDDSLDSNDGVAQSVKTIGAWLSRQGHDVSYLVGQTKMSTWAGGKVYSLAKNRSVVFNGNKMSMPVMSDAKQLSKVLADNHFDVINVMMPYSPFMSQRLINRIDDNCAVVGTFHIYPSGSLSKIGSRLLRIAYGSSLKRFSNIVSVSPAAAEFAKSTYGIDSQIIPNPVDIKTFSKAPKIKNESDGMKIVFLGRLVKRKGCEQLIKSFAQLNQELQEVQLQIAGSGSQLPNLVKLVRKYGISASVEFLGFVEETDKPALLASADIACFPSLYGESFGIVIIEAMAAGSGAVLAGDNPGYESVLSEKPIMLIDPTDTEAFADRLKLLLLDKELRASLQTWQKSEVKKYDIDIVGRQLLEVYKSAIAGLGKKSNNNAYEPTKSDG